MNGADTPDSDYAAAAGYSQSPLDYGMSHHNGTPSPPPHQQSPLPHDMYTTQASMYGYPAAVMSQHQHYAQFQAHAGMLQPTLRTVYLGNLTRNTTVEDILNNVRQGAIESCKILEDKNCAFVTFMDPTAAQMFHQEATVRRLAINGNDLKVGWGKPTQPPPPQLLAAMQNGATRVVFIGNTDPPFTTAYLREEFARFGTVDTVRVIPEKKIAFVHMASVPYAVRAVTGLQIDERWTHRRVNFGKDRCQPSGFKGGAPYMVGPMGYGMGMPVGMGPMGYGMGMGYAQGGMYGLPQGNGMGDGVPGMIGPDGVPNRTIYLGGINSETTVKELCDHVRGGILQNIKFLPDKGIAFVTFINSDGAASFFNRAMAEGLMIHGKRLKVGWGKTQPMPPYVHQAINAGATRNLYIGNVDAETFSEEEMRAEFEPYGEIEMINIIPEKSIAFINFADITSSIAAVEAKRNDPLWTQYRINYGKDRCGNQPKPSSSSGSQKGSSVNGSSQPSISEPKTRTPPARNKSRTPPPANPRPAITLSAFLAPAIPRPGYLQHGRSHSHQIRPSFAAGVDRDLRDIGVVGSGRPSSAQETLEDLKEFAETPLKSKHWRKKSTASVSSLGAPSSVPEESSS